MSSALANVEQPNIVLLVSDDLNYAGLSHTGGHVATPHIDSIFDEGVFFTDGYVTWSTCAPSRAGLMTGRSQGRFGYEINTGTIANSTANKYDVPKYELLLSELLKKEGYQTISIGKWHLGASEGFLPNDRGFDHWLGFKHVQFFWQKEIKHEEEFLHRNGQPVSFEGYSTKVLTEEACQQIQKNAESKTPFFLYYNPKNVHLPLTVPDEFIPEGGKVVDGMIAAMDFYVGEILNQLKESGVEEDTLVIFINDNGGHKVTGSEKPFRGKKGSMNEGGLRVPFGMKWPKKIKPGSSYREIVSSLDVVPTVMAAAGGSLPSDRPYDGVDLLPYLNGEKTGAPHDFLIWRGDRGHAMRKGDYKLIWKTKTNLGGKATLLNFASRKTGGYAKPELYDLSSDPAEKENLASRSPEVVQQMIQYIDAYDAEMAKSQAIVMPPYKYYQSNREK
ncbi:sulfatase-like hydrolase/transferase [Rubritalea spongiae]|uniref:Sulfatase-like hydrolase/transferase n=1 Tax=Rubritalea spongiae TaxID=430797 RepID=A0ABW5E3C4_9BACT